jgi:hypothetical protein
MKNKFTFACFFIFFLCAIIYPMGLFTWGSLPKAQDDETTIDEAIALAIQAHEEDPTSHLGEGESIDEHRKSEVIDHLASSVYDDKLAYDRNVWDISFSDLANMDTGSGVELQGLDTAYMHSSNSTNSQWIYGSVGDMIPASVFYYTKLPRVLVEIMLTQNSSQLGYILAGYRDESEGFGFKILNNKIYGFYFDSSYAEQTVEIQTITVGQNYKLEARVIDINTIEFYVNNVFAGSFSSITLPSTNGYGWNLPWIDFKSTTTTARELYLRSFHFEADI